MAEKELDLLQFSAIHMAKFCAGSPEFVWSEVFQLLSLGAHSNDVPDDIFGDSFTLGSHVGSRLGRFGRESRSLILSIDRPLT
jgi:hypothetical protein